jgi:hypothetical protein
MTGHRQGSTIDNNIVSLLADGIKQAEIPSPTSKTLCYFLSFFNVSIKYGNFCTSFFDKTLLLVV